MRRATLRRIPNRPPAGRKPTWIVAVVGLAIGLAFAGCAGPGATGEDRVLPDETLQQIDGGDYPLRQTGQPRALNLWATWCTPCLAELPVFNDVAALVSDVDIVGINTGDSGPDAIELIDRLELEFPQVLDPTARVQQGLRIVGLPATIFVSGDGQVLDIHSGELNREELEALLAEHFGVTVDVNVSG